MNWPLQIQNHTKEDKEKVANFILETDRWTQGEQVALFEQRMAEYAGVKYAVYVSSGSTANTLIAMWLHDTLHVEQKEHQRYVVFPKNTWATSVAPFIREGFKPIYIDVNEDFCICPDKLRDTLKDVAAGYSPYVAMVFPTALLGFGGESLIEIKEICKEHGVKFALDCCEATLSTYNGQNYCSLGLSTTSTYFGHFLQSVEGGFVFTNDESQYEYFNMARNHGLTRSVKTNKYNNPRVDPRFDFAIVGNNFRNSDINAFIGLLDLERIDSYIEHRVKIYKRLNDVIGTRELKDGEVPFAFPIFRKNKAEVQQLLEKNGIETRPIIAGDLTRHTAFTLDWFDQLKFTSYASKIHNQGFYVGLHNGVTEEMCDQLISLL